MSNRSTPTRGRSVRLSKPERAKLLRELKEQALAGDMQAALTLSNMELAEVQLRAFDMELDRPLVAHHAAA